MKRKHEKSENNTEKPEITKWKTEEKKYGRHSKPKMDTKEPDV